MVGKFEKWGLVLIGRGGVVRVCKDYIQKMVVGRVCALNCSRGRDETKLGSPG